MSLKEKNIHNVRDFLGDMNTGSFYSSSLMSPLNITKSINEKNIISFYKLFGENIFFVLNEMRRKDLFEKILKSETFPKSMNGLNSIMNNIGIDTDFFEFLVGQLLNDQENRYLIPYFGNSELFNILVKSDKFPIRKIGTNFLLKSVEFPEVFKILMTSGKIKERTMKFMIKKSLSILDENANILIFERLEKISITKKLLRIIAEKNYVKLFSNLISENYEIDFDTNILYSPNTYFQFGYFLIRTSRNEMFKIFFNKLRLYDDYYSYLECASNFNTDLYYYLRDFDFEKKQIPPEKYLSKKPILFYREE